MSMTELRAVKKKTDRNKSRNLGVSLHSTAKKKKNNSKKSINSKVEKKKIKK